MNERAFDAIARTLAQSRGRRAALRLLVGAAFGTASGLAGPAAEVDAAATTNRRREKRRPRRCRPGFRRCGKRRARCCRIPQPPPAPAPPPVPACQPGVQIKNVAVPGSGFDPGNGPVVTTPVLAAGQAYRLRATGFVTSTSTLAPVFVDAEHVFFGTASADVFEGFDVGVSVDGGAPNWGPFNADHVYETQIVGAGRPANLQLVSHPDLKTVDFVTVTVFCA